VNLDQDPTQTTAHPESSKEGYKGGLFRELAGAINFKNIGFFVYKPFASTSFKFDFYLIRIQKFQIKLSISSTVFESFSWSTDVKRANFSNRFPVCPKDRYKDGMDEAEI
jgi:hypothetical protein